MKEEGETNTTLEKDKEDDEDDGGKVEERKLPSVVMTAKQIFCSIFLSDR